MEFSRGPTHLRPLLAECRYNVDNDDNVDPNPKPKPYASVNLLRRK